MQLVVARRILMAVLSLKVKLLVFAAALASCALGQPCKPAGMAAVPSNVIWKVKADARDAGLSGKILIMETRHDVRAIDTADGRPQWEVSIVHPDASGRVDPMVVTHERVTINFGRELMIVAVGDGRVLARPRLPRWMRMLEGPPLIAVANNTPVLGSTLYALDADGRVLAKRMTRNVEALWIDGETVIARMTRNFPEEVHEMSMVSGFRAHDLAPLWSLRSDGAELQKIGARWYIGNPPWSPMRSIDLTTGLRGDALPEKTPTELVWGGATWEVEIETSADKGKPACERLRVNDPATGRPRWTVDLPFDVTNTVRDGDRFMVFGSSSVHSHFVAKVNWQTGKLERLWSGVPMRLERMYVDRDRLVGVGMTEGALSMRIDD